VAEGDFLAYSCAAARDFHPLPCLRRVAKTRVPNDSKSRNNVEMNVMGAVEGSQRGTREHAAGQGFFNSPRLAKPGRSTLPSSEQVQDEREHHAYQNGSSERKIECSVFAAIDYVAGETTEGQAGSAQESQNHPRNEHDNTENDQQLSEFCHDGDN